MLNIAEQIKEKLNIVEIIGSYIKVEKSGINYKARCPFHNEKTPSFYISSSRQTFYCFGCHEKGDVITFVEKIEGLDFKGAAKLLAEKAGIQIGKFEKENSSEDTKFFQIMSQAADFFENNLSKNEEVKEYTKSRGLKEETLKKWSVGFAENEWRLLHDHMISQNIKREDLLTLGLIKKVEGEEKYYDTFRGRIMFPIFDPSGRVIAFSGRIFTEKNIEVDKNSPKYINSPETPLFHKSEVLYGLNFAKQNIRKLDYTVFVEGQVDLVLSHQSGITNTVATSGTAITPEHIRRIKKLSDRIIFAFDGDKAGTAAAIKAGSMALIEGIDAKITVLPEGEDPASLITKDPEIFKDSLRGAVNIIEFEMLNVLKEVKLGGKMGKLLIERILPLLKVVRSNIERSEFIRFVSQKSGIPEESIIDDLNKLKDENIPYRNPPDILKSGANSGEDKKLIQGPEKMAISIYWSQVGAKEAKIDPSSIKKRLNELFGEEKLLQMEETLEPEKQEMIFEVEQHIGSEEKLKNTLEEIYGRIETKDLKEKLKKLIIDIDNQKGEERKDTEEKINTISKRIKEIPQNK